MGYVRTKNFIHDSKDVVIVNENGTLVVLRGIDKDFVERTHGRTWNTGTNVVLAQADTVKELIDAYVIIEKPNELPIVVYATSFAKAYFNKISVQGGVIYGAIWIEGEHNEPILKQVAEVTNKGDLKLL